MKHTFILILLSIFFIACTHKAPYTNRAQMILISNQQELALGEQSYEKTLKKSKVITNTKESKRVKDIGRKIAQVTKKDYNWEFNLIENSAKNAFCLPGGKVVVYTGILQIAKNDSQLATVISHEIAHALARHGAERVSAGMLSQGIQAISNIVLATQDSKYNKMFNIAYGLGAQYGVLMPYGRLQESEADEIGIYLMHKAGYDLNEAVKFWENMSKGEKENFEFLSTHPNSKTRIENIKKIISKLKLSKK
ncbi:peptidase M48 family protein [Malaciobacter halophilus]|uniref:Peptidase M48 family protein n=1 Tax=Malaciobacter halophilus TaxID=197482 RepID=A0A2N1J115_9BACT|nr:peptidase M48 family protein [Malaciobacter halophilus]